MKFHKLENIKVVFDYIEDVAELKVCCWRLCVSFFFKTFFFPSSCCCWCYWCCCCCWCCWCNPLY